MKMKTFIMLGLLFLGANLAAQTRPLVGVYSSPVHHEIANWSPVAEEMISIRTNPWKDGADAVMINVWLFNPTNHEVRFKNVQQFFDVRLSLTGVRAPETPVGCAIHFFSDCFQGNGKASSVPVAAPDTEDVIPPHGMISKIYPVKREYLFKPGSYQVTGVYCADRVQPDVPECIISDRVPVHISDKEGVPAAQTDHTGRLYREVVDSSPLAKNTIQLVDTAAGMRPNLYQIDAQVQNLTDHTLHYVKPQLVLDVRLKTTGERAPVSTWGCGSVFFDDCYWEGEIPHGGVGLKALTQTVPPGKYAYAFGHVATDYELKPGEYTVSALFCADAVRREGPECLRSNTLTFTVPPEMK